jgi:hypothetical protein
MSLPARHIPSSVAITVDLSADAIATCEEAFRIPAISTNSLQHPLSLYRGRGSKLQCLNPEQHSSNPFCGPVVRVPGYRSRGPGSIPCATGFLRSSGSGTGFTRLLSTIEELLGRKSRGSGLENRDYGRRDSSCWPRGTLYPQKLALTWLMISGGRYSSLADSGHGVFIILLTTLFQCEVKWFTLEVGSGIYSTSNRYEYQKQKNNYVSGE